MLSAVGQARLHYTAAPAQAADPPQPLQRQTVSSAMKQSHTMSSGLYCWTAAEHLILNIGMMLPFWNQADMATCSLSANVEGQASICGYPLSDSPSCLAETAKWCLS